MGASAARDGIHIRTASVEHGVPCITTLSGASAATAAIEKLVSGDVLEVYALQDLHD
jgi:carbamoyl-phosphate synthase large subunit